MHGRARCNAVLHLRRRRWVQFLLGGLQRLGNIAVQSVKDCFAALCQMRMIRNDRLHSGPHHGQDEITLTDAGVHFLVPGRESRRAGDQIPAIREFIFFTKAFHIVLVFAYDAPKLFRNPAALGADLTRPLISRIRFLFGCTEIAVSGDQFPDTLLHFRPAESYRGPIQPVFDRDPFAVVVFPKASAGDSI